MIVLMMRMMMMVNGDDNNDEKGQFSIDCFITEKGGTKTCQKVNAKKSTEKGGTLPTPIAATAGIS